MSKVAEAEAKQTPEERLEEVERAIQHQMNQLQAVGLGVPDVAIMNLKLECLIHALLRPDQMLDFQILFGESMVSMLSATLEEVHKQQNSFVQPKKGLIVPGRG